MITFGRNKRVVCLLAAACTSWFACAQQAFVVRGNVAGLEHGSVVTLFKVQDGALTELDADTVGNGVFRLSAGADSPSHCELYVNRPESGISIREVWVQAGDTVVFEGDDGEAAAWSVCSRNPLQAEQAVYDRCALAEQLEIAAIRRQMNKVGAQLNKASREEANALLGSMKRMDAQKDSMENLVYAKQFEAMKQRYVDEDGKVGALTVCGESMFAKVAFNVRYAKDFPVADEARAFYKAMTDEQRQSEVMRNAGVMLFPPRVVKEGEPMYDDAVLYDLDGGGHRLSDYNKGKYLLLDFWNIGCPPCVASFPELKELSEVYKDSLTVISISLDARKYWEEASRKHQITWVNLIDKQAKSGVFAHYGGKAFPTYVVISPEGRVVKIFTGYFKGRIKQKLSSLPFYKKTD